MTQYRSDGTWVLLLDAGHVLIHHRNRLLVSRLDLLAARRGGILGAAGLRHLSVVVGLLLWLDVLLLLEVVLNAR